MSLVSFRSGLQKHLEEDVLPDLVGIGTDSTHVVRTFDNHLHDFDLSVTPNPFPFLVVHVKEVQRSGRSDPEIRQPAADLYEWFVQIYYIDTRPDYDDGREKMDKIMEKVIKYFEKEKRLGNFQVTDGDGERQYVWDNTLTNAIFDSSGEEEYYTHVTELYLTVDSAKT